VTAKNYRFHYRIQFKNGPFWAFLPTRSTEEKMPEPLVVYWTYGVSRRLAGKMKNGLGRFEDQGPHQRCKHSQKGYQAISLSPATPAGLAARTAR
jgi:hypothetical protein